MNDPIEGEIYRRPTTAEPELIKSDSTEPGSEQGPVPCDVAWCDQRGSVGHPYDSVDRRGRVVRDHVKEGGYLSTGSGPNGEVWVDLVAGQLEGDLVEAPEIRLYASSSQLTPAQARQVAGWLTNAAEQLEALQ